MRKCDKRMYVEWYRLAEKALGDLILHPKDDIGILKWVSQEDWLLIPTNKEQDMEEAKGRPDPNIFFSLGSHRIRIGLVCNTQESVRKMRNILHEFHAGERVDFLRCLKRLDNSFRTSVFSKEYPYHFSQVPIYDEVFTIQANKIDDESIDTIFRYVDRIRERGRRKKEIENKRWVQVLPTIDIAWTRVEKSHEQFLSKITQLRPVYETCLKIKTNSQISREIKRQKKTVSIIKLCLRCGAQDPKLMFCPRCGSYLRLKEVGQDELETTIETQ